jgi:hypothetical protein
MIFKINFFKTRFVFFIALTMMLSSCAGGLKLPGADARKIPPNAADRVAKNLEEGKGFRLNDTITKRGGGGNFEFATSNELWRASLDIIDFMPLASANYSGGILITDWYSDGNKQGEAIKINIRFLTNEIRSDALDVNIFYKTCDLNLNCIVEKRDSDLKQELIKQILQKATLYKNKQQKEDYIPYPSYQKD